MVFRSPLLLALGTATLSAHDIASELTPLIVSGKAEFMLGEADTASRGQASREELLERPWLRKGELLESVPGLVVTQHSGDGKANQYFVRGYNLDHGTDFGVFVDGMPANNRAHAHGQGYTDINFIIPEFVQQLDYQKGPFFAERLLAEARRGLPRLYVPRADDLPVLRGRCRGRTVGGAAVGRGPYRPRQPALGGTRRAGKAAHRA